MTSTFFQRLLIIILLAGTVPTLWAQEYKYEIGGMALYGRRQQEYDI